MESKTYIVNNEPFEVQEMSKTQKMFDTVKVKAKELLKTFLELELIMATLTALLIAFYWTLTFTSWILKVPQDDKMKLALSVVLVSALCIMFSLDDIGKRIKKHGKR
jgi:glucan phosphoethanolaminetransferase (alkaline phosphatase superfamily)